MKRFLIKVLLAFLYWITAWFLAMQIAFWICNFQTAEKTGASFADMMQSNTFSFFGLSLPKVCTDPGILYWQGNNNYYQIAFMLILTGFVVMVLNWLIPSKGKRERDASKKGLTAEQKEQFTHRSSIHEAKRGLQRLQFNCLGFLNHDYYTEKGMCWQYFAGHADIIAMLNLVLMLAFTGIEKIGQIFVKDWIFVPAIMRSSIIPDLAGILLCMIIYMVLSMPVFDKEAYDRQFLWYFHKNQTDEEKKLQKKFYSEWLSPFPDIPVLKLIKLPTDVIYKLLHYVPHIRDYTDFLFNGEKKAVNDLRLRSKAKANNNFNVMKYKPIDGFKTGRKAGLPILTYRSRVYVEPDDLHDLTVATTNSGKTYSVINGLIEVSAMAGHSMFINDIKNELYQLHAGTLERLGYNVIKINFINPEDGECWNPFGGFISRYREQQKIFLESMDEETRVLYERTKREWYKAEYAYINDYPKLNLQLTLMSEAKEKNDQAINDLQNQINLIKSKEVSGKRNYENWFKQNEGKFTLPDYSEAYEQLHDICTVLCEEKDTKQPFFWQQAAALLEGLIAFLAEYEEMDEQGMFHPLDDDQINFKNVELLKREGLQKESTPDGTKYLLGYWIDHFRLRTDKSAEDLDDIVNPKGQGAGSSINDVLKTFDNHIRLGTMNEKISKMFARTSFDFSKFGTKKTAIFMIVQDEKSTYYPFVTIFFTQFYHELIKESRNEKSGRLPIPFEVIWDEFGISPAIPDIDNVIAACRSRSVRLHLVVQDYSQLDTTYKRDTSKSIQSNIASTIFLMSNEDETLKRISNKCGTTLHWNEHLKRYDAANTIPENELRTLSLSEGIVIRNRRMPLKTNFLAYNRYVYYPEIKKIEEPAVNKLKPFKMFSLHVEMQNVKENIKNYNQLQYQIQEKAEAETEKPKKVNKKKPAPKQKTGKSREKKQKALEVIAGSVFKVNEDGIAQIPVPQYSDWQQTYPNIIFDESGQAHWQINIGE